MSSERFAQAWFSKTNERERIKAEMYFLGVMDATEGKTWCSYQRLLPPQPMKISLPVLRI
jgi:hypothetical protein